MAEAGIYIAIAMTLSVYNIEKAVEDGVEITPAAEHSSGTIWYVFSSIRERSGVDSWSVRAVIRSRSSAQSNRGPQKLKL